MQGPESTRKRSCKRIVRSATWGHRQVLFVGCCCNLAQSCTACHQICGTKALRGGALQAGARHSQRRRWPVHWLQWLSPLRAMGMTQRGWLGAGRRSGRLDNILKRRQWRALCSRLGNSSECSSQVDPWRSWAASAGSRRRRARCGWAGLHSPPDLHLAPASSSFNK